MPTFLVYILYSSELDKFYIGMTGEKMEERLRRHLSNHKGYTAKAKDWQVFWTKAFANKSDALAEEKRIKDLKRRSAIMDLLKSWKTI